MSNAPSKQTPSDKAGVPPSAPNEVDIDSFPSIRVHMMKFVTNALPISGVNAVNDHITARKDDKVSGVDIWYIPELSHFKVVRLDREVQGARPKMIHVSRVEFWEPL